MNARRLLFYSQRAFGSEGTSDNSPAVHCRVSSRNVRVPKGRLKIRVRFVRPSGTCLLIDALPGVKMPGYSQKVPSGLERSETPKPSK
jgi:hypothetical protein